MSLKTADKILLTARTLFNEQGESNITASDIALELDISPGNLYYHFKGKDSIHLALFAELQRQLVPLLATPVDDPEMLAEGESSMERCWLFLTVVLEQMLEYRYLYHNPPALMARYPEIDRGFRRLLRLSHATCLAVAAALLQQQSEALPERRLLTLSDTLTLNLTYWLSYDALSNADQQPDAVVHRGVLQLLATVAPYMGQDERRFYDECEQLYDRMQRTND